jgi:hypothetical protein
VENYFMKLICLSNDIVHSMNIKTYSSEEFVRNNSKIVAIQHIIEKIKIAPALTTDIKSYISESVQHNQK